MFLPWNKVAYLRSDERVELQNRLLRKFFRHQLPYSPHYRQLFEQHQLKFEDIKTVDDLQRVPFTSKADLAPTEDDRAKPRTFILQPDEHLIKHHAAKSTLLKIVWGKITKQDVKTKLEREYKPVHMHFTTGRTALPTPFVYSSRDLELLKETGQRLFEVGGFTKELRALNGFPYSPHLAFWLAYYAMVTVGMTSLATGGGKVMGTQKITDAMERLKINLATFIPGYCYHLLREAVKQQRDFSDLKFLVFGGERVSDGLRQKVREMTEQLKAREVQIYATYALTEAKTAWLQCSETTGYHLYPDLEYIEVIDKDGNRLPDGSPGEIVYTALDWRGSVVVRYRTGDLCKGIEFGPCPVCRKTVPRIIADIQRSSDVKEFHLTKIKGELVNLNEFYPLLSGIKDIEEWQVIIKKHNDDPNDLDEIDVLIAPKQGVDFVSLKAYVEKQVQNAVFVSAKVKQEKMEKLLEQMGMETELKEKRIVDARPKV
ncbi:MAG: AMP-binding protein [Candidatus Kerfeldbacteria bacterium]|nr:AMP-binding protein [Candidatus Kerfeldbacteria bacterium]